MSDSDLTPGQSEEVRRLLAGARHSEPMPDDVALRFEETLASLSRERAETTSAPVSAPPIDLAARRRRRIGAGLLAAAAVTVVGFSVPNLLSFSGESLSSADSSAAGDAGADSAESGGLESGGLGSDDSDSSEEDRHQDDAFADSPLETSPSPSAGNNAEPPAPSLADPDEDSGPLTAATARAVRPTSFARDVARIVADEPRALLRGAPATPLTDWCPVRSAWGKGTLLPVRYLVGEDAATRAVLVVRPVEDGEATTDLFVCGEDEVLRSTTVSVE